MISLIALIIWVALVFFSFKYFFMIFKEGTWQHLLTKIMMWVVGILVSIGVLSILYYGFLALKIIGHS